jgi:hypothetical protein
MLHVLAQREREDPGRAVVAKFHSAPEICGAYSRSER